MISVTAYTSKLNTDDFEKTEEIRQLVEQMGAVFVEISIDGDADLNARYAGRTPLLQTGPYTLASPFSKADVELMLLSALQRDSEQEAVSDASRSKQIQRRQTLTSQDRLGLWLTRNYVRAIFVILAVFTGLPFLAPVLEEAGQPGMAQVIYSIYRPFCHELAFRSYFLFGEQAIYPRSLAGVAGVQTYEQVTASSAINIQEARNFVGNSTLGYKVALCERDLAIYGSLLLFALVFELRGKKMKQIQWYWWIIIAVLPIALDGFSQLPGLMPNPPAWMPIRESTPFLRTLTGLLFGYFSGWFVFPLLEETVATTRLALQRKLAVVESFSRRSQEGIQE
jgi:uncharacterized membrane protein